MSKQRYVDERERVPPKEGRQSSLYAFTLKTDTKFRFRKGHFPCKHQREASMSVGRFVHCGITAKRLLNPSEDLGHTRQQWRPDSEHGSLTNSQSKCRGSVSCPSSLHGIEMSRDFTLQGHKHWEGTEPSSPSPNPSPLLTCKVANKYPRDPMWL